MPAATIDEREGQSWETKLELINALSFLTKKTPHRSIYKHSSWPGSEIAPVHTTTPKPTRYNSLSMGEEVKVLGSWGSPFSKRVEMVLKLKGVEYEFIEEDITNKSPLLLEYNPVHKKIPVFVHSGKPIAESVVIMEYIDETWKSNPIMPKDPYDRAVARFWAKFIDEKCLHPTWKACWSMGEEQEKAAEEAHQNLKILENELKGKKFFGGETIGLVDITANFIGFWVEVLQEVAGIELITAQKFPKLCEWIQDFNNCSAIKENLPPRDKLLALFKARFASLTSPK